MKEPNQAEPEGQAPVDVPDNERDATVATAEPDDEPVFDFDAYLDLDENERMAAGIVHADLRDAVLTELKAAGESWQQMSEFKQEEVIFRIDNRMRALVRKVIRAIVSHDFPLVSGTLDQITVKDEIKVVVKIPKGSADRFDLFDSVSSVIGLIMADPGDFAAVEGRVRSDPDQPDLPLNTAGDGDPDPSDGDE